MGIELKFYDTLLATTNLTAPTDCAGGELDPVGSIDCLNAVTQGDGESQRDGRKMNMHSLTINGSIKQAAVSAQTAMFEQPLYFLALVHDKQCNAATINSEDVFSNPSGDSETNTTPFRNLQFINRFDVLKTWHGKAPMRTTGNDAAGTFDISGSNLKFSMHVKLGGMPVVFKGTSEAIANITDNAIHLVGWASVTSGTPAITYQSRVRFTG